ncbi:MAG: aspartate-semialdehyde dehydrogenase [candidate division WOR-3 bacterium]|nr:aspartate-semialdehyde dehydrogenase [candidate division WOR-3 bacterium]MCX7947630.1 aspartate-semialdehyde dehydrogenase [candidate division WOR-3 bacterium]MDW8150508.1 aspartate-semialdehyde dehydrogenase [candidate division WOR-3 bacterium]
MKVAVFGATGLVGSLMIKILEEKFDNLEVYPFASEGGRTIKFKEREIEVKPISEYNIPKLDFALFAVDSFLSKLWKDAFLKKGAIIIDNSSAFRLDKDVPLVVPEVNIEDLRFHKGLIANPNCSTIQLTIPLKALMKFSIKRVSVSTYQSVSGSGRDGLNAYHFEKEGKTYEKTPFSNVIYNNLIPQIGNFQNGYSEEEWKIINETRKILKMDNLIISATAVRVPIEFCHSQSVEVELEKENFDLVEDAISNFSGIVYKNNGYFTPRDIVNKDEVYISRLRKHPFLDNVYLFWSVFDNLRKGAALNAIQIMEALIED